MEGEEPNSFLVLNCTSFHWFNLATQGKVCSSVLKIKDSPSLNSFATLIVPTELTQQPLLSQLVETGVLEGLVCVCMSGRLA